MNIFDNMGGFKSAGFVLLKGVESFVSFGGKCSLTLHNHFQWQDFPAKQEGITIKVEAVPSEAGTTYAVKGSIICKRSDGLDILKLAGYILMRYQTVDGIWRVAGTKDYPLSVTVNPVTPTKPSGFYGTEVVFEGNQLIEPPVLML